MQTASTSNDQLSQRMHVSIAGAGCTLFTNSVALARVLEAYAPLRPTSNFLDLRITVISDDCSRSDRPHFRGLHHVVVASFSSIDRFVFDLRRRTILGMVSRSTVADESFWRNVFIPICMGVMGPAMGVAPVHCACLEMNGEGTLIAGASGAGKSTLAVALARAGMSLISDDWTYVAEQLDRVVAHGLRVPVKLLPDAVQYFPELRKLQTGLSMNGELAYEFDPAATLDVKVSTSCHPTRLIFVERGNVGDFRRMSSEMAFAYFTSSAERLPNQLPEAQALRRCLLERLATLPCYVFRYCGTPESGASALKARLSSKGESA